jgi:hypothetical protein
MKPLALITLLALGGCAALGAEPKPNVKVTMTGTDYCKIARPIDWGSADTIDTINDVRRSNAKYHARCS